MKEQSPTLQAFILAVKQCSQVIIKQRPRQLEEAIEAALIATDKLTDLDPQLALLLLNCNHHDLSMMDNLVAKQLLTVSLLCHKLNLLPKSIKTVSRSCFYILYSAFASLKKLKQGHLSPKQYQGVKTRFTSTAFTLAYKLKIEDKEVIKLLSQLAQTNKFCNTNQLIQTVTLLSFNTSLAIGFNISKPVNFEHALNTQLAVNSTWLGISYRFLNTQLPILQTLSEGSFFAGNVIYSPESGYYLAVCQSADLATWHCLPFDPRTKAFGSEVINIESELITRSFAQVKVDITSFWQSYINVCDELPTEDSHFSSSAYYDPITMKYSVPEFWPQATQALLNGNIQELSDIVDSRGEFKQILLSYASTSNRNNIQISSSKHAITLLGLDRVFPVIASGMMELVEDSYKFTGSDELNNKVAYLTALVSKLAESKAKHSLPEYHSLIVRLLSLSLFTIPKVAFSASSHSAAQLKVVSRTPQLSLAEIYQYPRVELWLKIALHLIDTWKLPNLIKQFVTKYLTSLNKPVKTSYSALELEWLEMVELSNLLFLFSYQHDFSDGFNNKLDIVAKKHKLSREVLEQSAKTYALELNYKTSLQ